MKNFLLLFFFTNFFSINLEEKNIISKYLDFENFNELLKETGILEEKNLNEIGLKELNKILQEKWFKGATGERWEIKEEDFKNSEKINELIKNIYKKDGIINFDVDAEKNIKILENKNLDDVDVIIIFGSTFLSILSRALSVFSIINNRKDDSKKIKIIFLTGYRKVDEKVDFSEEKRSEILKDFFPKVKNKELYNFKSSREEELVIQIKSLMFETVPKNCEVEVFSENEITEGRRATTESTLKKLLSERNFTDKKIIGISYHNEFINYQQSVVDSFLKQFEFNYKINVLGFDDSILNLFSNNDLLKGRKRSLSEKLDTISRIIFNCTKIC